MQAAQLSTAFCFVDLAKSYDVQYVCNRRPGLVMTARQTEGRIFMQYFFEEIEMRGSRLCSAQMLVRPAGPYGCGVVALKMNEFWVWSERAGRQAGMLHKCRRHTRSPYYTLHLMLDRAHSHHIVLACSARPQICHTYFPWVGMGAKLV